MAQAERPNETLLERWRVASQFETRAEAAQVLGISVSALQRSITVAKEKAAKGELGFAPVLPGFEISSIGTNIGKDGEVKSTSIRQRPERGPEFAVPDGTAFAGGTYQVGGDGRIERHWPRVKLFQEPADIAAEIKAGLFDVRGKAPFISIPKVANEDLMASYFIADAHLGQRSWHEEVGVNYDLEIAEEQLCAAYEESIYRAPDCDTALVAILGDFCHADDDTNATPASKHPLDVDGRHGKTRRVASRILKHMINLARGKHRNVIFRYIPGNHDPKSAGWLSHGMWLYFDGFDRVTIDDNQGPYGFYEFGVTMNGLFHGDKCKPGTFRNIACTQQAEMWGRTKKRYGHSGHIHKRTKIADECGGMYIETHQAVTAQDVYAHSNFELSGRSLDTVVYSRFSGEYNKFTVPIEDRK